MLHVANPIYDIVFKYLMEDKAAARTLLSALLKKTVLEVEVRKHEYTNGTRDKISMFRIDFGATVREADGSKRLILIELQKTWLETETLRFRQYLGAHYANPENIIPEDNPMGYAIPMVTIYLLGHRVGDIEEPILYVNHKAYNYDGQEVKRGIPDPFVDSLVHNSIIVQIPRLPGHLDNRLEKVLSVFDQTHKDHANRQVLNIDETAFAGDHEMMHIIHRLQSAASDASLRQDMNVEDEYFSAIENRDTAIMARDKKIKQQNKMIENQKAALENQKATLEEQKAAIENQKATLEEQKNAIEDKNATLKLAVKAFVQTGMNIADIAATLHIPEEDARLLMEN